MTLHLSRTLRVIVSATLLTGVAYTLAHAQPEDTGGGRDGGRRGGGFGGPGGGFGGPGGGFGGPGGGFGGPGGFGGFDPRGGLSSTLRNEQVQQELGITEEQKTALEELEQGGDGRDAFRESFDRMRTAQTDEERQQIQTEMAEQFQARQKEREDKLKEILGADKSTRLEQLSLQRSGSMALYRDDVAESLGLEQSQRDQILEIGNEYRAARDELGRDASDEDRQKLREEYDAKYVAVMNASQQATWQEKLGPKATYELNPSGRRGDRGGFGAPPGGAPAIQTAPQAAAPAPQPMIVIAPPEGAVVVSSFGAPAGAAGDRDSEAANISFTFRYAPWVDVLKLFADRAGFTLDLNTVPPGTFNYYDDGTYTVTQALDILNGYLIPKGYILVRRDRFLVCLNLDDKAGIPLNLVPNVEREELYERGLNELMTVVFSVEGANIDETVKEVSQLLGPQGKPVGLKSTNSIVVTDIGSSLRRIDVLLQQIAAAPESTLFKSYPLANIAADEAEITLRAMLGLQLGVTNISAGSSGGDRGDRGGFDFRDPRNFDRSRSESRPTTTAATSTARLYAELRTNSIMVTATPAEHKIVEAAIQVIDIDETTTGGYARGRKPYLVVYEVNDSDPQEVVKTLSVLIPGVVVNEDGRNEKIHIVATEAQHREVATLIRQLDGMGGGSQVLVIPLVKMDPVTAGITLRAMFAADGEGAPTIEPDLYGRQLMIRGTSDQLAQAQSILTQLGEDGTGVRKGGAGGLSTFSVYGRDPDLILELLQKSSPSPIRIVRPKDRGPVEGIRSPARETPPVEVDLEAGEPSAHAAPASRGVPVHLVVQTETRPAADDAAGDTAPPAVAPPVQKISDAELDRLLDLLGAAPLPAPAPVPAAPPAANAAPPVVVAPAVAPVVVAPQLPANPDAPVTITVMGDDLLISTDDPATRPESSRSSKN